MKTKSPFTQTFEQLPDTLPVFPLPGAVLLPGGDLPLNIFEPRYLNMVQDALATQRLIGMIQPLNEQPVPELYPIGCAGRITRYLETEDGRLEIVLSGVCRFRVLEELAGIRGYRVVRPDWQPFAQDYQQQSVDEALRQAFRSGLERYFAEHKMQADWDKLEQLSVEELSSNLIAVLPLNAAEKQLLLEAPDLPRRLDLFCAVLQGDKPAGTVRH